MLKLKITKEEFEALPDAIKAEYKTSGEGYSLDVTGIEDTGALKRAKDRESELRKEAENKLAVAEARIVELESDTSKKDVATLTRSYEGKLETQKTAFEAKINKLTSNLVNSEAMSIATRISKAPKLLVSEIAKRLQADIEGDKPTIRITDADGNASAMTMEDLEKEFVANPDYSAIIIANKSSGGAGGTKEAGSGGNQFNNPQSQNVDLNKMSSAELVAYLKAQKESAE